MASGCFPSSLQSSRLRHSSLHFVLIVGSRVVDLLGCFALSSYKNSFNIRAGRTKVPKCSVTVAYKGMLTLKYNFFKKCI